MMKGEPPIPTLTRSEKIIPGLYNFRRKSFADGLWQSISFLLPFLVWIASFDRITDIFRSLAVFIYLLVSGETLSPDVFQYELVAFWLAALVLMIWMAIVVVMHNRFIHRTHPSAYDTAPFSIYSRIVQRPSSRWALRFLIGWSLAALLTPLLAPENPLSQKDLVVTRRKPPLSRSFFVKINPQNTIHTTEQNNPQRYFMMIQRRLLYPDENGYFADSVFSRRDTVYIRQGNAFKKLFTVGDKAEHNIAEITTRIHWLGRDAYGRDILSRLLYGSRVSFSVSLVAVTLAVLLGVLIGAVAGYAGGITDGILMRMTDMMLAFPIIFLILLMTGFWGSSPLTLTLLIGLSGWMGIARLVRGEVLSIKEKEYILAARALGYTPNRILFRHILPNALTPVIVSATLRVGTVMMVEAGLSFLGLGLQPPAPSWGNMILEGRTYLADGWWISVFPGVALISCVVALNILGDALRDAVDPRITDEFTAR